MSMLNYIGWKEVATGIAIMVGGGFVTWVGVKISVRISNFVTRLNNALNVAERLEKSNERRCDETKVIFRALYSIIDALEKGHANGNVHEAKDELNAYLIGSKQ